MKLAVLADIHANLYGMQAVFDHIDRWGPDQVVVAGDVINRGPRPLECLTAVLERKRAQGWQIVLGNHEQYVIHQHQAREQSALERELFLPSRWTAEKIAALVETIAQWPLCIELEEIPLDSGSVRITHASMRHTRDGIFPQTRDDELPEKIGAPAPALLCVGHTHIPLMRRFGGTLIVNVGAAGMPFDGDQRVSYAQLTWRAGAWHAEIIRLRYDHDQAERDFVVSGFIDQAGPLTRIMLEELRGSYGLLFEWTRDYEARVLAGELGIAASVEAYLRARRAQ